MNLLYYGDNLDALRRHLADESVDLVYLDPPFNSNASYNVLFAERDGSGFSGLLFLSVGQTSAPPDPDHDLHPARCFRTQR